jgi:hypothetical protein
MASAVQVDENPTTYTPAVTPQEIAARAYELYLLRGAEDGHALEDWLRAERELVTPSF